MVPAERRRRIGVTLFVLAIALYVPGIWWGLPHAAAPDRIKPWGPDELGPVGPIAELYSVFVDSGPKRHGFSFNPQYPLFHYVVQAVAVGPYVARLWLTGDLSRPSVEYPYGLADPVTALAVMTLIARLVSLVMAAAVIVIAYRTATILWDHTTAVIASLLVLLTYPMFYYSRTSNVDMAALFWTSLGLAVFAACLRDSLTPWRAVWLGTFAALATATKDASYAAFLILPVVLLPRHLRAHRQTDAPWRRAWNAPLLGLLSALATYAVASGLVFHPARYLAHVSFIVHGSDAGRGVFYYSAPATLQGYLGVTAETTRHVVEALGLPAAAFALGGLLLSARRRPRTLALALPAVGVLAGVILPVRYVLFRFVIILAYVLAFFAASALAVALRTSRPRWRAAAVLSLLIVCGWSLLRGADLTYQMLHDSRYEVAAWFQRHAKPGDRIGYYGEPLKLPPLGSEIVTMAMPGQLGLPDAPGSGRIAPEFITVIPVQHFERVHEWTVPTTVYRGLQDGSSGYRHVLALQTPSLFAARPISFVNPPVKVFVRNDRVPQMSEARSP